MNLSIYWAGGYTAWIIVEILQTSVINYNNTIYIWFAETTQTSALQKWINLSTRKQCRILWIQIIYCNSADSKFYEKIDAIYAKFVQATNSLQVPFNLRKNQKRINDQQLSYSKMLSVWYPKMKISA